MGDGPDFLAFRRRELQSLYGADAVGGVVVSAVHLFWHQVLHGGHARAGGTVEGHPAFTVVVFVDADAAHMVHVHGQAAGFYVAGHAEPVLRLQAGFEQAVAGRSVANAVGLPFADLVLHVVECEVAEDGAVEHVTHQLLLGEAGVVLGIQLGPGVFQAGFEIFRGLGANALQVQGERAVFTGDRVVFRSVPAPARLPVAHLRN